METAYAGWHKLHPGMQKILKRQCEAVDADYRTINFGAQDWFRMHQWPEKVELAFQNKLAKDLMKDKELREGLMEHPVRNKKVCLDVASEFVWNYGWTYPVTKEKA